MIPGFVDSHGHLVFAGDRAEEFAARMAGRAYTAGGIKTTVAATRAASDEQLGANLDRLIDEALRSGTTTVETKSGYGLTVPDERRSLTVAQPRTPETTFLGAHVVAARVRDDADAYVDLVKGEMLDACAPHARWIDVFCEDGAFDGEQTRAILTAGIAKGLTPRVHANQLAPRPGRPDRGRARSRQRRPLHARHRRRHRRAGQLRHRRHAAARRRVQHPRALPRRPPPDRRRRHRRARRRLQPRLELHDEHPVLHRDRRPRDAHDARRGRLGGDRRAARERCDATDIGHLAPGARADAVLLDAPRTSTSPTAPASRWSTAVWRAATLSSAAPAP